MSDEESLDLFGRLLMTAVRDRSIHKWDRILDGSLRGRTAEQVRQLVAESGSDVTGLLHELVPRIVDSTIFWMLQMFEESPDLCLYIRDQTHPVQELRDQSDGLAGELFSEDGWIQRFSHCRHYDDM